MGTRSGQVSLQEDVCIDQQWNLPLLKEEALTTSLWVNFKFPSLDTTSFVTTCFYSNVLSSAQECTNIFSKGGGQELAKHAGVPFLGEYLCESKVCPPEEG